MEGHRNWSGNVGYSSTAVVEPTSVDELAAAVASAAATGSRVRALGSRHSFSTVADTDGLHVSTRRLDLPVEVREDDVVVPSGMTYAELAPVLHARGRALANLASLPHLSVAGACATGTHGSGDRLGGLATAVVGAELVTGSGDVVQLGQGDADLGGVAVSLGALGVITRLWLRTEAAYDVAQRVWTGLPAREVAEQLPEVLASGNSVSVFTDLHDPDVVSSVWVKDRVDRPGTLAPVLATRASSPVEVHPVPGVDPTAATAQLGVPGPWHERLPHFRAAHQPSVGAELQSELFLPRAALPDLIPALAEIADVVRPALLVHEIRSAAADDLWLSPLRGRDSVMAHFTWRPDPALAGPAIRAVEQCLAPWQPRAHWAKLASPALRWPEGAYDLTAFTALANWLDPMRTFQNRFTALIR